MSAPDEHLNHAHSADVAAVYGPSHGKSELDSHHRHRARAGRLTPEQLQAAANVLARFHSNPRSAISPPPPAS